MKKHFYLQKKQYFSLGFMLIFCSVLYFLYQREEEQTVSSQVNFVSSESTAESGQVFVEFDPNALDEKQWRDLGFTTKQVTTILKYKKMLGGYFSSKEQLKKCYVISDEKFQQLSPYILLPEEAPAKYSEAKYSSSRPSYSAKELRISSAFNPNAFSEEDWQRIGFSERQAKGILKYKSILGGAFSSKEKLRTCFMISDEQYRKMEPYILLPEKSPELQPIKHPQNALSISSFDPNELDKEGWQRLGFSEKQAMSILRYKENYLKGSFRTMEDVEKNFIIKGRWEELKPHIVLDESKHQSEKPAPVPSIDVSTLELNSIKVSELMALGFSERNATGIVGYRKALGGFMNQNQLFEVYNIDREKAQMLVNAIAIHTENIPTYTLVDAPESWLKTHPYFKYHADKIIYFRISNPNERKIWKFINVSPEKKEKMKWYLRNGD